MEGRILIEQLLAEHRYDAAFLECLRLYSKSDDFDYLGKCIQIFSQSAKAAEDNLLALIDQRIAPLSSEISELKESINSLHSEIGKLNAQTASIVKEHFPTPLGATWDQLWIRIYDEEWANITLGNITKPKVHNTEMGFAPGRKFEGKIRPGYLWQLLLHFAKSPDHQIRFAGGGPKEGAKGRYFDKATRLPLEKIDGEFAIAIPKHLKKTMKTNVSDLRSLLKSYFGIPGKPISDYGEDKCFRLKFHIEIMPFEDDHA
jgi:hypothetical protein